MNNSMKKGLTVKDLVTTGIFTALVFVFVLVGGIFFAPNPVLTFFMPAGSGLPVVSKHLSGAMLHTRL